jgi:hypothetical protein
MKPFSDLVAGLSRQTQYVVWLDYDTPLTAEILQDIDGCTQVLAPGSILIVTVEAEPRLALDGFEELSAPDREKRLLEFFRDEFESLVLGGIRPSDVSKNDLPILVSRIVRSHISDCLISRSDLRFHQLFNFLYADGCQMLTLGGIIDDKSAANRLRRSGVFDLKYLRTGEKPKLISVPPLTVREKGWIDNKLKSRRKDKNNLGLNPRLLRNYVEFYKYYPTYYETLT